MRHWNILTPIEKIDSLTKVLTRAGSDPRFRRKLLNQDSVRAAVQNEADAIFDQSASIRILADQAAAEREIVLLLPQLIESADIPHKADDYLLCTYIPYVDAAPLRGLNASDQSVSSARIQSIEPGKNTKRWNTLSAAEKLDSITNVLTRAGSDPQFRKQCLNPISARSAVQTEAGVVFDEDINIRVLSNQDSAEREIVLLLPPFIEEAEVTHKADDYWLCTWFPYVDEPVRTTKMAHAKASIS